MISISFYFSYFRPKLSHFSLAFISSFAFIFPIHGMLWHKNWVEKHIRHLLYSTEIFYFFWLDFVVNANEDTILARRFAYQNQSVKRKHIEAINEAILSGVFNGSLLLKKKSISFRQSSQRQFSFDSEFIRFFFFDFATTLIHFLHWLANQYHFHLKYRINFHSFHSHQLEIVLLFAFSWHVYMVIVLLVSDCDNIIAIKSKTIQCIISIDI